MSLSQIQYMYIYYIYYIYSFNLHVKFRSIEQLGNIPTIDKETLKFQLKHLDDFWIQKFETQTPMMEQIYGADVY